MYLMIAVISFGQEYSYVHYQTKDGLSGSTVYDMCQDKDGFIWLATENGLSRYDGTQFKNYSTADGLPDNEVLKLFCDKKGRVWICPFSKDIAYYYEGKIYTKENDSVLAKITLRNNVLMIAEDNDGNVAFSDLSNIVWVLTHNNVVLTFDGLKKKDGNLPLNYISIKSFMRDGKKEMIFSFNSANYYFKDTALQFYYLSSKSMLLYDRKVVPVYNDPNQSPGKYLQLDLVPINRIYKDDYSLSYITTSNGSYAVDTSNRKLSAHFLPGKKVTNVMEDDEGNTWFSTLGEGLFKLPSKELKVYHLNNKEHPEAFSIAKSGASILIGSGFSSLYTLKDNQLQHFDFSSRLKVSEIKTITNRLFTIANLTDGGVALGFDSYLIKMVAANTLVNPLHAIKSVCEIDSNYILAGTARGAYILSGTNLKILDTIWNSRCTKVFYHDGRMYIGTLNGLFEVYKNNTFKYFGTLHPSLKRRITDIVAASDKTLWISTHDKGLVALRNNKLVTILTDKNGLISNNCKTLFLQGNYLWVGTNTGINKINLSNPGYPMINFSASDGLVSNNINAIYAEDSMVYICTAEGLSFFNEKSIVGRSGCKLKILQVEVSGRPVSITRSHKFEHNDNNFRVDFAGISFKSSGDITYQYKLEGLDTSWQATVQNSITYPSLPSGEYTFRLQAINKFGAKSVPFVFSFGIATPWWRAGWFLVLSGMFLLAMVWYFINLRYKKLHHRNKEMVNFKQRIADLEQLAFRSQMNPHFIFNCLSSIQNFIINQDLESTNKYLNGFSRILRQTLDHSMHKVISIAEEVTYLSTYLDLEKMRFENKFDYAITVDENIPQDFTFIPNMILQPFVENSIRHGMLYMNGKPGLIEVNFTQTGNALVCTVRDNGVGMKNAGVYKTSQHIEYHSQGMQLTYNRLALLSNGDKERVEVVIADVYPQDEKYPGTSVQVIFPLTIIDKLNMQR